MQDTENMAAEPEFEEEEEPSFSDPEDFVDDIDDEGKVVHDIGLNSHHFRCTRRAFYLPGCAL